MNIKVDDVHTYTGDPIYTVSDEETKGWQRCPICYGEGSIQLDANTTLGWDNCPTCEGKRIISISTGRPPV